MNSVHNEEHLTSASDSEEREREKKKREIRDVQNNERTNIK